MLPQVEFYKLFSGYRANGYGYGLAAQYSRFLTSYICQAQGPHFEMTFLPHSMMLKHLCLYLFVDNSTNRSPK